jgi:Tol biopolymer transport system component
MDQPGAVGNETAAAAAPILHYNPGGSGSAQRASRDPVPGAGVRLGPYEILAPIGAGGMGEVYKARDTRLGRDVAIKVLPAAFASDPDRLRRFEQEARATAALDHPNILAIHDFGTHEGSPYLVEELLGGSSLRDRLKDGPLLCRKAVEIAAQVAGGLAAAHARGIVHRDLKPENVFVTTDGVVKILDFGLARLKGAAFDGRAEAVSASPTETGPGVLLGTVGYMAPEQVRGQGADHRADIFSLGVVVYETVTGKHPFARETSAETMTAILKTDPPEPALVEPTTPLPLSRAITHCLEKSPDDRYQSARDLAFDLGLLSGLSAPQHVPGAPVRWPIRRRLLATGVGLAALAALFTLAAMVGRRTATHPVPSFTRLTFRQGRVGAARFTSDGETIVYSAAWEGGPRRLYLKRPDAPEALPLDLPGAFFFSLSSRGEVALVAPADPGASPVSPGVLSRAPLSGRAPREIVASVTTAEWTPDGSDLAIVRSQGGHRRLEFPPSTVLFETAGHILAPRFSPDGERIAFSNHPYPYDDRGSVAVVDRSGTARTLTREWSSLRGLAWSPSGDEIWFAATEPGHARSIYAVTLGGRLRVVLRAPGDLVLNDVSPTGRAVVAREEIRYGIPVGVAGEAKERDLTWLGRSFPSDLSRDGKVLLFTECASLLGADYAVCLRRIDGSPPVVLGKGGAYALSPDGAWALASLPSPESPLLLLPTGPGDAKKIELPGIAHRNAAFFPDGRSILFEGYEKGRGSRLFRIHLDGGPPEAVTPEGQFPFGAYFTISPDGAWVAATGEGEADAGGGPAMWLYPIAGGKRRPLPGPTSSAIPIRWSADGKAVLAVEVGRTATIVRVDVATGRRAVVRKLTPADPLASVGYYFAVSQDETTYAYMSERELSELYIVEGLR